MDSVNDAIISALSLPQLPGEYYLQECEVGYECKQFPEFLRNPEIAKACGYCAIYPDQLVYMLNEVVLSVEQKGKIVVGDTILYRTGAKEAAALHETLLGVAYVISCISDKGLIPEQLSDEECAQIFGWDSEKYRKSLMK